MDEEAVARGAEGSGGRPARLQPSPFDWPGVGDRESEADRVAAGPEPLKRVRFGAAQSADMAAQPQPQRALRSPPAIVRVSALASQASQPAPSTPRGAQPAAASAPSPAPSPSPAQALPRALDGLWAHSTRRPAALMLAARQVAAATRSTDEAGDSAPDSAAATPQRAAPATASAPASASAPAPTPAPAPPAPPHHTPVPRATLSGGAVARRSLLAALTAAASPPPSASSALTSFVLPGASASSSSSSVSVSASVPASAAPAAALQSPGTSSPTSASSLRRAARFAPEPAPAPAPAPLEGAVLAGGGWGESKEEAPAVALKQPALGGAEALLRLVAATRSPGREARQASRLLGRSRRQLLAAQQHLRVRDPALGAEGSQLHAASSAAAASSVVSALG
jgi:hypothetical protein